MDTFARLGLEITEAMARAFAKDGITLPTEVQQKSIPVVLANEDVVVQAGTGTGKTLAYVLPLLQRARLAPEFRAVILASSPELAMQILRTVEAYKEPSVRSASLIGSGSIERQKDRLKQHPQLIVGTPGRVLEMIFARKVQTRSITALVLDEVDQILSPENEAELREICSRPEFGAQIIMASATIGKLAEAFAQDFMAEERVRLQLTESPLRERIRHRYALFPGTRHEGALVRLIRELEIHSALVFVHKKYNVAKLFHALTANDISCVTLSADTNKQQREKAMAAFRSGRARMLVATDAAARGLDIKDLEWVIHFELANDKTAYLHRAGRTGRAGNVGTSIVMVTREELPELMRHARELHLTITAVEQARS